MSKFNDPSTVSPAPWLPSEQDPSPGQSQQHVARHSERRGDAKTRTLQVAGIVAAIGAGTARPLMTLIFGGLVNTYNSRGSASDLNARIDHQVLLLVIIFIGQWTLICGYGICFSIAAMRTSVRLRASYLRATVRQDLEDVSESRAATDFSVNINAVEEALSEKLGVVVQAVSTVVTSFIIAFTRSWRLTLVMLPTVIILICSNFGSAAIDAKLEHSIQEMDRQASALAEECSSAVRTIAAYLAHEKMVTAYAKILDTAKRRGVWKSPVLAAQYSISYFVVLSAYALGFWYGTKLLVAGQIANGGAIVMWAFQNIYMPINADARLV
jgi:ATP-binding cassette, subfamily B (MDR/TAP), member 1